MYTLLEKAKVSEAFIYQELGEERFGKQAKLYSLAETESGDIDIKMEKSGVDIYEVVESPHARKIAKKSKNIIIVTTGWAAPLVKNDNEEVAPSEHPERRRVLLNVFASDEGMVSTIRFSDSNEVLVDEGRAAGALAEAISDLWATARS
jgi:hypothetical protein